MKKKFIIGISAMILLMLFIFTTPVKATDFVGHSFTEEHFAVEVDLAVSDPSNPDLIRDLLDTSAITEDSNEPEDLQFYVAYMNNSGIEAAYSAFEKLEHDITFGSLLHPDVYTVLSSPIYYPTYKNALETPIFHINATAPFQQLVQHYTTPWEQDVFVTNNFMTLIAYSSSPDDQVMDSGDELYIGYTFSVQELIDAVNTVLTSSGHPEYQIGNFDYTATFEETANGYKFGIEYTNMFVLWQRINVSLSGPDVFGNANFIKGDTNGIIYGQDIVAASVLDYIGFEYIFETQTITGANSYVLGTVETHYNIGETNFLVTKHDDAAFLTANAANFTNDPFIAAPVYNFAVPSDLHDFAVPGLSITVPHNVLIHLPQMAFYIGDDAKVRMRMANSFGLTVATATTTFGVSVSDPQYDDQTDDPTNPTIDLAMGGNTFFFTEFTGKNTYKLKGLDVLWGIDPDADRPVNIRLFDPMGWAIHNVAKFYFRVEFELAYGFTKFIALQLTPQIFSMPGTATVYIDTVLYFTFTEFPEWYGGEIIHDPSYSAVAAMAATPGTTTTDEPGPGSTTDTGIPGFEFLPVLLSIPPLYALYRKKR